MFEAESSGTEESVGTDGNLESDDPLPTKEIFKSSNSCKYTKLSLIKAHANSVLSTVTGAVHFSSKIFSRATDFELFN